MNSDYSFIKDLKLLHCCKIRDRSALIVENETQRYKKRASVAQNHKVGHPGHGAYQPVIHTSQISGLYL